MEEAIMGQKPLLETIALFPLNCCQGRRLLPKSIEYLCHGLYVIAFNIVLSYERTTNGFTCLKSLLLGSLRIVLKPAVEFV